MPYLVYTETVGCKVIPSIWHVDHLHADTGKRKPHKRLYEITEWDITLGIATLVKLYPLYE